MSCRGRSDPGSSCGLASANACEADRTPEHRGRALFVRRIDRRARLPNNARLHLQNRASRARRQNHARLCKKGEALTFLAAAAAGSSATRRGRGDDRALMRVNLQASRV